MSEIPWDWARVKCPTCHAEPQNRCRTKGGRATDAHMARVYFATNCARCGHPSSKHRYGYGPCRHVEIERQTIHDLDDLDGGREVQSTAVFCNCLRHAK